jgi:DNA-binding GntR family transcriptional regulator
MYVKLIRVNACLKAITAQKGITPTLRAGHLAKDGEVQTAVRRNNNVVVRAPMHDQILPRLRRDIVENRWKSGERLSEPLLCKEFGVSRTPLRQALNTLEAEGLIELIPHVGAVVTDPDAAEVGERMEILIALEQLAATRVTEAAKPDVLRDIQAIQDEMIQAVAAKDAARYYALNDRFHLAIVRGAGNKSLADLHEKIMWHVHRERHRVNFGESVTSDSASSHEDLMRAILARQSEAAGLAMRKHLEHVSQLMLAHRQALAAADAAKVPSSGRGAASPRS